MNAPKVPSGPGPWMRWAREMIAWQNELKPISGQGTLVSQQSGGRAVNVRSQPSGSSAATVTKPFTVSVRSNPSSPGTFQWSVYLQSSLYFSRQPSQRLTISGLDTWNTLDVTDLIWLLVTFNTSTGVATAANINSLSLGNLFDIDAEAWNDNAWLESEGSDPPKLKYARLPIAQTKPDINGKPVLTQFLENNVFLELIIELGRPAFYPVIGAMGYIA